MTGELKKEVKTVALNAYRKVLLQGGYTTNTFDDVDTVTLRKKRIVDDFLNLLDFESYEIDDIFFQA